MRFDSVITAPSGHTEARRGRRFVRMVRLARLALAGSLLALLVVGLAPPRSAGPLSAAPAAADMGMQTAAQKVAAHQEYTRLLALGGTTQTKWGPLTAADREVLIRVRQANLWERPVSLMAQDRSGSQQVKDVGRVLAADHQRLDELVLALAKQLGMDLPDQPNPLQQGWVAELSGMRGQQYDVTWANRLRSAHGTVFGIIAEDRAATENSAVRQFAQTGVDIVMKHMTLLEGTGLFTPTRVLQARAAPIRGPISFPVIVIVASLILVANLILARRRSWH